MNQAGENAPQLNIKKALNLSDEAVEGMYAQAYRFYEQAKYEDAYEIFRLLVMIDGTEMKYVMGLASCLHMLKEYSAAAQIYTMCSMIDAKDPKPHYHVADCHIKMGDKFSAMVSLEMAINRAGTSEYAQLKERAALALAALNKEMMASRTL